MIACVLVAAGVAGAQLGGCSSGGPKLSGFGLGNSRIVSVGETVELRTPVRSDGTRQWRISSYDSLYLGVSATPQVVQRSDGSAEVVFRATAKTPGETTVELTEIAPAGVKPQMASFKVTILE